MAQASACCGWACFLSTLILGLLIVFSLIMCGHLHLHFPKENPGLQVVADFAFFHPVCIHQAPSVPLAPCWLLGLGAFLRLRGETDLKEEEVIGPRARALCQEGVCSVPGIGTPAGDAGEGRGSWGGQLGRASPRGGPRHRA